MLKYGEVPQAPLYENWREFTLKYGDVAPVEVQMKVMHLDGLIKELPDISAVKVHPNREEIAGYMYFKGTKK